MISSSAMADALVATLKTQSASRFATRNLSKNDFSILDTSGCEISWVVLPGGFDNSPLAFGNPRNYQRVQNLRVKAFVRDMGTAACTLDNVWRAERDLMNALAADDTLGGSANSAYLDGGGDWDGLTFIGTEAGVVFVPIDFTVRAEYADGT